MEFLVPAAKYIQSKRVMCGDEKILAVAEINVLGENQYLIYAPF